MDLFLLHAVAAEAAARLVEQEVLRVACLGLNRYLIRFATPRRENLLIAVRPDLPRVHLVPPSSGRQRETSPDPFGAFLDAEIGGGVLTALTRHSCDRVLELRFRLPSRAGRDDERRLVVELLGRSANLLCLDAAGTILAHARNLQSEFRAPAIDLPYSPPLGRDIYRDIEIGPDALPLIRERFEGASEFLRPLSPLLAQDVREAAAGDPELANRRLEEILRAAATETWAPTVYSPRPLDQMNEGEAAGKNDLIVAPLPLLSAGSGSFAAGLHATPFDSPSEAAAAGFGLLERLRDFQAAKAHHEALIRKEIGRLVGLVGKLEAEQERARGSDRYRLHGEALLAGLASVRVREGIAYVPDPYRAGGESLAVPIDPALTTAENAQALFTRYKKGKRGLEIIGRRLAVARARLDAWRGLSGRTPSLRGTEDLESLRDEMARLGLVHVKRSAKRAPPSRRKEVPTRVRRHSTREGFDILVGKSGAENDSLTFRVASPWDLWLHAADYSGAHVIVRNPRRLKRIPDATLRTAAEIAAFYSGARSAGKVEVHYTQRKHVHKRKGMPNGQVLLRRFHSIQVMPRIPTSTFEDL
jgi:predicted ribosome quality control (RQC) complex YloA/Tae2 family protein